MLGLVLLYFLGKAFYDLAGKFDRNQWGYALLGIASYYAGSFIAGVIIYVCYDMFFYSDMGEISERGLSLIALPFGLLAALGVYKYLARRFANDVSRASNSYASDILDDDF